jgi:seryl-tRNA synthetase
MRSIRTMMLVLLLGCGPALAQDIAGVEDCTKTTGLDRRTGCLQSNVNFLQRTITRNALEAHRRLQAAESELAALRATVAELRKQLDELAAARKVEDKQNDSKKKQ